MSNVFIEADVLSYKADDEDGSDFGLYIGPKPLGDVAMAPYFEVEILEKGSPPPHSVSASGPQVLVGLCSKQFPVGTKLGSASESVAFHVGEGSLYRGRPRGQIFGSVCEVGDKICCGIRPMTSTSASPLVNVTFMRNGQDIGQVSCAVPPGGFFPAVGLERGAEDVAVVFLEPNCADPSWPTMPIFGAEDSTMLVDSSEEEWTRLHDIKLNGQVLEYVGRGKSLIDVGLAQAKSSISTRNHYFEIEIVDPGASCYIAIGLARRDYPKNRHPGWNRGSIAYHADDGKVFVGSGVGSEFGPRCHKGDVMGCGILFPRNYECKSDSEEELEQQTRQQEDKDPAASPLPLQPLEDAEFVRLASAAIDDGVGAAMGIPESGDEDEYWWTDHDSTSGVKVQIYFTRNNKVIGTKEIRIPKGGFYPTIGMMSAKEKVRVDLKPLSG